MLKTTLKYHLFHGIGEEASDTVFTRSFSTLLIALIVCIKTVNKDFYRRRTSTC
nr:DUF2785 domain-containing protein [Exiguobacterium sp. s154]